MYFSRFRLNAARRATRTLVASPQAMHAAVLSSFPQRDATEEGRVLWRLDSGANQQLELYVVSPQRPDFTHLDEQAGWPTTSTWDIAPYDGFLERLAAGQQYRFRLQANTVASTKAGVSPGDRGRRVPVGSREQQEAWLLRRCAATGIEIPGSDLDVRDPSGVVIARRNLGLTERDTRRFSRARDGAKATITLATARFDGLLVVSNAEFLRAALCHGIGSGKAYGCGLLTLARA